MLVPVTVQDRFTSSVWNFWPRIADVTLRDSHVVARANERRPYSQARISSAHRVSKLHVTLLQFGDTVYKNKFFRLKELF